jgi:hypothetical protein
MVGERRVSMWKSQEGERRERERRGKQEGEGRGKWWMERGRMTHLVLNTDLADSIECTDM